MKKSSKINAKGFLTIRIFRKKILINKQIIIANFVYSEYIKLLFVLWQVLYKYCDNCFINKYAFLNSVPQLVRKTYCMSTVWFYRFSTNFFNDKTDGYSQVRATSCQSHCFSKLKTSSKNTDLPNTYYWLLCSEKNIFIAKLICPKKEVSFQSKYFKKLVIYLFSNLKKQTHSVDMNLFITIKNLFIINLFLIIINLFINQLTVW